MSTGTDQSRPAKPMLIFYMGAATFTSVACWLMYAVENLAHFNIDAKPVARGDEMTIWFPVIVTPVSFLACYVWYWRKASFVSHAVPAMGRIAFISSPVVKSVLDRRDASGLLRRMVDVTFTYEIGRHHYTQRQSVFLEEAGKLRVGDQVDILVDSRNPRRARLASQV